jgi:hypothetical protein
MMQTERASYSLHFLVACVSLLIAVMFYEQLVPSNSITWFMNNHPYFCVAFIVSAITGMIAGMLFLENRL